MLVILLLLVTLIRVISYPFQNIRKYDDKTIELGHHVIGFTQAQWAEIYHASGKIFASHKPDQGMRSLRDEELPELLRGMGFDRCGVCAKGVFYERVGSGWSDSNATWIHSVHAPDAVEHGTHAHVPFDYDHRGIYCDGWRSSGFVYMPDD